MNAANPVNPSSNVDRDRPAVLQRSATRRRRFFARWALPVIALGLGVAYRVELSVGLPVGYDEVFVIAVGLLEMGASKAAFWLDVPMQRSSALAPLWWWVEYLPFKLLGDVTQSGVRIMPLLCSLTIPVLGYFACRRRFGRRTALGFALFLSLSDVLAYCTVRAEFFESLLMLAVVPLVCGVGRPQRGAGRGVLWAVMLLTFFGKALFIIGLNVAAEGVVLAFARGRRARQAASLLVSLGIAAAPVALWFFAAHEHYQHGVIRHEAMPEARGVGELIRGITLGYGEVKRHVVGTAADAALVYLDARVWPTTALSSGLLALGLVCGASSALRPLRTRWTRLRLAQTGLSVWAAGGAAYVILSGTAGARFHLMYLPAAWLLTAASVTRLAKLKTGQKCILAVSALLLAIPSLGWAEWSAESWSPHRAVRTAIVLGVVLVALSALGRATAKWTGNSWALPAALIGGLVLLVAGPLRWGPAALFEPMYSAEAGDADRPPYTDALLAVDARSAGRSKRIERRPETLEVLLSNYFRTLQEPDITNAVHYADRAVLNNPEDVLAWTYLGLATDLTDTSIEERQAIWKKALDLKPDSAFLRQRHEAVMRETADD